MFALRGFLHGVRFLGAFQPVFALHRRVISGSWTGLGRGLSSLVEDEASEDVVQIGQCHASCGPRLTD